MMEIPPKSWGAVELIIWEYANGLKALGHDVVIFNSKDVKSVVEQINKQNFDFIHLQYDEYINYFNKHLIRPFCVTSHYGYISKKNKWSIGYYSIFEDFLKAPGIIALSPEIANLYKQSGYKGLIYVLRNGANTNLFKFIENGNKKAICLGKIELRKRQAFLSEILDKNVDIDFVGPLEDKLFKEGKTTKYLGSWNKDSVYEQLTNYNCLVLFSDGEAAPMVVPEALSAGLSIIVSESASANLDKNKNFISVLGDDCDDARVIIDIISKQIIENNKYRKEIRNYALSHFDFKRIVDDYNSIINDFTQYADYRKVSYLNINPRYLFSRLWVLLSHFRRNL